MNVKEKNENLITTKNNENDKNTSIIVTSSQNDFIEIKKNKINKKEIFSIFKLLIIISIVIVVRLILILFLEYILKELMYLT